MTCNLEANSIACNPSHSLSVSSLRGATFEFATNLLSRPGKYPRCKRGQSFSSGWFDLTSLLLYKSDYRFPLPKREVGQEIKFSPRCYFPFCSFKGKPCQIRRLRSGRIQTAVIDIDKPFYFRPNPFHVVSTTWDHVFSVCWSSPT